MNLTIPTNQIKSKLQSLLEQGHVDEYFVEDIRYLLQQQNEQE